MKSFLLTSRCALRAERLSVWGRYNRGVEHALWKTLEIRVDSFEVLLNFEVNAHIFGTFFKSLMVSPI